MAFSHTHSQRKHGQLFPSLKSACYELSVLDFFSTSVHIYEYMKISSLYLIKLFFILSNTILKTEAVIAEKAVWKNVCSPGRPSWWLVFAI